MPKAKQQQGQKQFDETNRGALFHNDKGENSSRPDMTGFVTINPELFTVDENGLMKIRLAAWNRSSERAGDYLSIAASNPDQQN